MKRANSDPLALSARGLQIHPSDWREILLLELAQKPGLVKAMKQPGCTWLWGEATTQMELYVALQDYREAYNSFLKVPYSKLSVDAQWLARRAVVPFELAYYWLMYDIRVRDLFYPYCEQWAVEMVKDEASPEGSFVRAIEADLRLCMLLETVGDHTNGFKRFGEVFLQRFTDSTTRLLMQPDATCPSLRKVGRDLCGDLVGYESWLKNPTLSLYMPFMPVGSDPVSSMMREAQFLRQQRQGKSADVKWALPWIKAWRAHYGCFGSGTTKIKHVQIDGDELVRTFRGKLKLFKP